MRGSSVSLVKLVSKTDVVSFSVIRSRSSSVFGSGQVEVHFKSVKKIFQF